MDVYRHHTLCRFSFSPVTPTCSYPFISASLCLSFPKAPLPSGPTSPSFLLAAAPGVLLAPSRFHWTPALAPWSPFFESVWECE